MTTNRKIAQLSLIMIGVLLILSTYFFYPAIKEGKFSTVKNVKENISVQKEIEKLEKKEQALIDQIQKKLIL